MRLNKYIAHCGICSRRKAAELVKAGKIKVNGQVEKNPAILIEDTDKIEYKGKILRIEEEKIYLLLNKPKNMITTLNDPEGRRTVNDLIKKYTHARVFPVGRLDRNTTGLLLITNDGDIAQKLSHPSYEVEKVYEAQLDKPLSEEHLKRIRSGFDLEDGPVMVDAIHRLNERKNNWVTLRIHIGRNRIVRRIFEHFGYEVKKLDRVLYAGLTKKAISRAHARHLTEAEIRRLKYFI